MAYHTQFTPEQNNTIKMFTRIKWCIDNKDWLWHSCIHGNVVVYSTGPISVCM